MRQLNKSKLMLFLLLSVFTTISFSSCSKDEIKELSSEASISSFSFKPEFNSNLSEEIKGSLENKNINLTIPYDVSIENLIASFEYEGVTVKVKTVEQESGVTQNDFTRPVYYHVIAEDGSSAVYTIKVEKEEKYAAPELKSFSFLSLHNASISKNIDGIIEGNIITLYIPSSVDAKSIVATFDIAGTGVKVNNIEQENNVTQNDFTNPVVYTIYGRDDDRVDYTVVVKYISQIPTLYINTENGQNIVEKELYIQGVFKLEDTDNIYSESTTVEHTGKIRGRGNSTWGQPKKPYRIKFDKKQSLLGMTVDKNWVLLANHFDKTLLRNVTAFEISRIVGMGWTPRSINIHLYLNDKYLGVYGLTEKIEVSSERVNYSLVKSADISGEAITGDYLLELDFHYDEEYKFKTDNKRLPIMFAEPKAPEPQQFEYVRSFFNRAEQTLYSDSFRDKESGYRKYIDVETFINYYIVHELAKNVDGNMRGSCYLGLRKNGKIEQPLIWDFDIAFGNANHITWEQGASSVGWDGWYIKTQAPWFDRFFQDPDFVAQLKNRWNELKPELDRLPTYIKTEALLLDEAQQRNFGSPSTGGAGWDITSVMWPNHINRKTYQAEVDYLVDFVERRLEWLDKNINAL